MICFICTGICCAINMYRPNNMCQCSPQGLLACSCATSINNRFTVVSQAFSQIALPRVTINDALSCREYAYHYSFQLKQIKSKMAFAMVMSPLLWNFAPNAVIVFSAGEMWAILARSGDGRIWKVQSDLSWFAKVRWVHDKDFVTRAWKGMGDTMFIPSCSDNVVI